MRWPNEVKYNFNDHRLNTYICAPKIRQIKKWKRIKNQMKDPAYNKSFDSTNLLFFLMSYRKPIIIISMAAAIISAVVSLMIQEKYLSTVILFPRLD